MKNFVSVFLLAVFGFYFSGCTKIIGEGPIVTETRDKGPFSAISVSISGDVYYQPGPTHNISIQAQQNILEVLETNVKNNELEVKFKNNVSIRQHEKITVTITAPTINSLTLSGSGNVRTIGNLQPADFHVSVAGSGNITIPSLNTNVLDAAISGSGNININAGTANQETLKISGSGSLDLLNVAAKKINTTTSGSGSMKVHAIETLHATISGSGAVYYKGSPAVSTTISGSGRR